MSKPKKVFVKFVGDAFLRSVGVVAYREPNGQILLRAETTTGRRAMGRDEFTGKRFPIADQTMPEPEFRRLEESWEDGIYGHSDVRVTQRALNFMGYDC
ncbi:MAG: hypothetical protein ACRBC3_19600 [Burkholderiaceae bacterium]